MRGSKDEATKAKSVKTTKPTKTDRKQPTITEKQRTVVLIVLLIFALAFIYWIQNGIDDNFTDTL